MKNHIAFKFIAIILCAASLMGAIGGIAGVVVLTESNLYNKTVSDLQEENTALFASEYANALAMMYTSSELGGCPEAMVADAGSIGSDFLNTFSNYGYNILDADGNTVSSYNPELNGAATTSIYSFPITGQYMHLVSVESESERIAREAQNRMDTVFGGDSLSTNGNSAIPAEGIALTHVIFLDQNGNPVYEATCYDYQYNFCYYGDSPIDYSWGAHLNQTGRLFCNQYGKVVYTASEREDMVSLPDTDIYEAVFFNEEQDFRFQITSEDSPIGLLTKENDIISFTSYAAQPAAEADAEAGDVDYFIQPDFYESGFAEVFQLSATLSDGSHVNYGSGEEAIGSLIMESGKNVYFETFEPKSYDADMLTKSVTSISFRNKSRDVVFSMSSSQGTGTFSATDAGILSFTSHSLDGMNGVSTRFQGQLADADGEVVPAKGMTVSQVTFTRSDGSVIYEASCDVLNCDSIYYFEDGDSHSYSNINSGTGFLFYNPSGQLVYTSFLQEAAEHFSTTVYGVNFYSVDEILTFQLEDPNGLGTLTLENGRLVFTSYPTEAAAAETVSEAAPEHAEEPAVAETAPEIMLDEDGNPVEATAPEETTSEAETEAIEETVPSSASAVPEETEAPETSDETTAEETASTEGTESTEATEAVIEPTVAETVPEETVPAETVPEETIPAETEPVLINGRTLDNYQINTHGYYDPETHQQMTAKYVYVPMPELTVEVYADKASMQDAAMYDVLSLVREFRNYLLPAVGICLLLFAIFTVYLCTAAGRKPGSEEVRAGGLNRLPLDLYLLGGGFGIALLIAFSAELVPMLLRRDFMVGCGLVVATAFLSCLIFVGFCFAFVAQIKTPDGYWWHNSLCGRFLRGCARFAVWLEHFLAVKGLPATGKSLKKLWILTCAAAVWLYQSARKALAWIGDKLGKFFHWIGQKIHRWLSLMPVTWQWTVIGLVWFCITLIAGTTRSSVLTLICLVGAFALVLYGAHCFGVLLESTKKMAKGDLDTKVDDKLMVGSFKEFAGDLNDLADVAVVAAQKQLKSERMKTELITNVSHDIKTPLTSIINYVDLLQKPHTAEEEAQYLEVLDRQSLRLKKLIDDLIEMSKASTGNMAVDITTVDAVESVNQALGEFSDKLDRAQLIPVFRHDDDQVPMMADGRLVWRVMSNLLSNAVKYAMPGTRLYIDLMTLEGKVIISLKNISREELNEDADELLERFVRGDDSRNTEGSGLGLNIAKSLMELQKGQLQLLVDGDLFKVTLIFPGA